MNRQKISLNKAGLLTGWLKKTGCSLALVAAALFPSETDAATTPDLAGKTGWTAVMYGTSQDPQGDSQAGAADTDIVADATHGSLYVGFADGGTTITSDDYIYFRLRVDNPTDDSPATFNGVAVVGIDANLDGRIDMFLTVDGRNSSQVVRLMDPGTGANISPNTTTTVPLPTGWLANNGIYSFSTALYQSAAVSIITDPHWNSDNDLGNDGTPDIFVSWRIPMDDLATVLAIPSPVDRDGNYGPRGSTGISNYTKDSLARYVAFTQTQSGPINGDLNGVGRSYDKNATFASLGAFTEPMSASNPVSASDAVTITDPVDANGYINSTERTAVQVYGTIKPTNGWVMLTITNSTTSVTNWTQGINGFWTNTVNLSAFSDGLVTFTAQLVTNTNVVTVVANSSVDTATATIDTIAPIIYVNPLSTAGKPVISGTSSGVPVGSYITVRISDGGVTNLVTYTAVVNADGTWSVNTAVVAPTSGTMPSGGLSSTAFVVASGPDIAGNTGTYTALTAPTVNILTANDTTPSISGTWGGNNGGTDVLQVTVNGITYTAGDGNLVVSGTSWTLTIPSGDALGTGSSPYDVTTRVTRTDSFGTVNYDNTFTDYVSIVSGPFVDITSNDSQPTRRPVISGDSSITNGVVIVRIDPNNDGNLADAITYTVATDGNADWSLNTTNAVPSIGSYPVAGIIGTMGILVTATDDDGIVSTDSQTLVTSVPTVTITAIYTTSTPDSTGTTNSDFVINRREDDAITVTGTSTSATNQTLTVTVSDGDAGTTDPSGTATVQNNGSWTVSNLDLSALRNGYLTFTATVLTASTSNNSYTHDSSVPLIRLTTQNPLDKNVGMTIRGVTDLTNGTTLTVKLLPDAGTTPTDVTTTVSNGIWSATFTAFGANPAFATNIVIADANATDAYGNRPAASRTNLFSVGNFGTGQYISPITNAVRISTIASDNIITTDEAGSVTISGTSITNGTVQVTISRTDGTVLFGPLAATISSGTWSTAAQNLSGTTPNGPLIVTATLTNAASPQITYSAVALPTLLLGTVGAGTAPTISITTVGDGNLSSSENTSVTISGTTTSVTNNAPVTITISDTSGGTANVVTSATVDGSGNWSVTGVNVSSQVEGALTISVSVPSNSQTATDSVIVNHDKTAQALAITSGPSPGDSTPIISGTSGFPAGTILTVGIDLDNDGDIDLTYYATVQSDGTWSVDTGTQAPASGTFPSGGIPSTATVTVSGSDSAGNASSITSTSITSISSDNGVSAGDFITNDPTLTFNGRGATNQTVSLILTNSSGTVIFGTTTTADASGNWSYSYPSSLASGNYTLIASVTLSSTTATAVQSITVDTVAPAASTIDIAGDTGTSGTDFITSDNTLVFDGTGVAPNSSVSVTLTNSSGTVIFTTTLTADGSGEWTIDLTSTILPDGVYTLVVTTTDSAGNVTTVTQTITIDTSAEITITNNATTGDTTPTITGTTDIETGRSIVIDVDFDGNGLFDDGPSYSFTNTVSAGGVWSVDVTATLPLDTYTIRATGTDAAGNAATGTKLLTVDTNVPALTITEPIGDGNLNASEDNSVTIQGTSVFVPNGSTVSVSITDGTTTIVDSTTVSGGVWSFAPFNLSSLDNGTLTVTVTYSDAGGSIYSDTATVLHDKSGTTTIDGIGLDTATLSDFITKDTTLTFSGSAGGGSGASVTLTLTNSAGQVVFSTTVVADASGNWSYTHASALTNDVYGLTASSGTSFTQAITVDTVIPTGPVTANAQTTDDTTPTITGTATVGVGETLTVTVNGITYTAGDGNLVLTGTTWTLTIPPGDALDPSTGNGGFDGEYTVTATVTDVAGNELSNTSTLTVTVYPTLTAATGGGAISADNFGTGTYVTLTGPIYTEGVSGDVSSGTIILTAPAGFQFDTGTTPTVLVTGSATASENINDVASGATITATSITASQITLTVTAESMTTNTLTWQNIRVRPTAGTPLVSGNITMNVSSTGDLTSVVKGTTNFGTLSVVPGTLSGYKLSAASGTVAAGSGDLLTIYRVDQYGNTITNFTGDVTLTFSGPGTSPGGTAPTITDKDGNVVSLGSVPISFTNGVSSLGGSLVPYKAETVTVHVTDGTYSTSTTGGSGVSLTVSEGTATAYRITAATSTPTAGADDVLTIRRVDQYGNTVTSLTGDVSLTFSGLGTSPAGNIPTITSKTGSAVNQGTATTVTFTSGVSTLGGTLKAYRAETATLAVTDGTLTSGGTGGTGATLTVSAGAEDAYRITAASSTPTAGATDALTIRVVDTYGNTVTSVSGDRNLTFSGLGTSANGTIPTVTSKTGTAVNQGTSTTITFTSGVSTAGGVLIPYRAETATLHVTDGTNSSSDTGGTGAALTVSDTGTASAYRITAATTTPNAGAADALTIRLVDIYGNAVSGFNGDLSLTFSGLGSVGSNVPTVTDKNGSAVNQGTTTIITFTNGVNSAGGSLIAYKVETATLHTTDGTRTTATTGGSGVTLTITGGTASRLGFLTQPGKAEVGEEFKQQPVVQTQDAYGNPTTSGLAANLTVTIALTAGSGTNGTLGGQLTFDIGTAGGNGTVTFTNLIVSGTATNTAGSGNRLTASAPAYTDGVSAQFDLWTIYMESGDIIVADRGPYFSTGTILISRGSDPTSAVIITSIKDPYEVAREIDGNFVVVDYETSRGGGLFRIDRLTFAVSNVSSGGDFKVPFGVKVETKAPNAGKIIVADLDAYDEAGAVFRVDPVTGVQTTLSASNNFYFLQGLAIAPTNTPNGGDIYVTSVGNGTSITSKLIKIDPTTGAQTVISSADNFIYPVGVAVETDGNLIVADATAKKVIRINPGTGVQTVLSDASNAGQGTPFLLPTHVAIDAAGDIYVSDGKVNAGVNERLLFKVNKTTGNRVLITQDGFFEQPRGLELIP